MTKFASYSASFIATNAAAYKVASTVFAEINGNNWQERLANAGIIGAGAVREFATVWVAAKHKAEPKWGQRGWTFNGVNQAARDALDYIVKCGTGSREGTVQRAKAKASSTDPVAKMVEAYSKLDAAQKRAFQRAIAK
jgi:hypothetical protein